MQTIAAPMLRTGHRLFALVLVAVALVVIATLGVVHYAGGSAVSRPTGFRSSPVTIERCVVHRPC